MTSSSSFLPGTSVLVGEGGEERLLSKQQQSKSILTDLGPAVTISLLLSNWGQYTLSDRIWYHFCLTNALIGGTKEKNQNSLWIDEKSNLSSSLPKQPRQEEEQKHAKQIHPPRLSQDEAATRNALEAPISSSTTTTVNETTTKKASASRSSRGHAEVCGVVSLLECVPTKQWHKLSRRQNREFKTSIRKFNLQASQARQNRTVFCHEPLPLPIPLSLQTRVFFAYEVTRMAFCLDASPTITSSFGFTDNYYPNKSHCCPMDKLPDMARHFFSALIEPIHVPTTSTTTNKGFWQPILAVTVLAVYPRASDSDNKKPADVLVRDYRVTDAASAAFLSNKIQEWAFTVVENQIAKRLSHHRPCSVSHSTNHAVDCYNAGVIPIHTSSLQDMIDASHAALTSLPSEARPCIVVATDCQSVSTEGTMDIIVGGGTDRSDTPLIILDLSSTHSHNLFGWSGGEDRKQHPQHQQHLQQAPSTTVDSDYTQCSVNYHDHYHKGGDCMFPLHFSDDAEALLSVCHAMGGCFFDSALLLNAAKSKAGSVELCSNPLSNDHFFAFKRHSMQPNAVQWYILFTLSQLSPTMYSNTLGRLVSPEYIRSQRPTYETIPIDNASIATASIGLGSSTSTYERKVTEQAPLTLAPIVPTSATSSSSMDAIPLDNNMRYDEGLNSRVSISSMSDFGGNALTPRNTKQQDRTIFSTYVINPISIHGILLSRVKEGYMAKQYGQNSNEPDRVSIQMIHPLSFFNIGTLILHYELSYKSLPNQMWIGFAHIKIELSGQNDEFIALVKHDFLLHQGIGGATGGGGVAISTTGEALTTTPPITPRQHASNQICKLLRRIRREDMLQSHLSPLKWSDQLSSSDTPFLRRLRSLSNKQRKLHFQRDEFDCVCISKLPWASEDDFLQGISSADDGEQELVDVVKHWATQQIDQSQLFVKQTQTFGGLVSYAVIELKKCAYASRLTTVVVETFGWNASVNRYSILAELKIMIDNIQEMIVLPKQLGPFLVKSRSFSLGDDRKERLFYSQLNHASWDLVKDIELLPLLMRRRGELGKFLLLESSDDRALFAKLELTSDVSNSSLSSDAVKMYDPGDLVQYQLTVAKDKVIVHLHMECEGGYFVYNRRGMIASDQQTTKSRFQNRALIVKRHDQECGHALRCRTILLQVFDEQQQCKSSSTKSITETNTIGEYNQKENSLLCVVRRLLPYASKMSIRLRFFNIENNSKSSANNILESLVQQTLLSRSTFQTRVAKLQIDSNMIVVDDIGRGHWYAIELDKQTTSMAHLSFSQHYESSSPDKEHTNGAFSYREITFFTVGITDLYSKRDDFADDGSDDGHISEHMHVSKFCDTLLEVHRRNFSAAAYLSLQHDGPDLLQSFNSDDFDEIIKPLQFVEVARVVVGGEVGVEEQNNDSKLLKLLRTVLHPIAEAEYCVFYNNADVNRHRFDTDDASDESANLSSSADLSSFEYGDIATNARTAEDDGDMDDYDDNSTGPKSTLDEDTTPDLVSPPIFVRFQLDDNPIKFTDISHINESAVISVLVSVFTVKRDNKVDRSSLPFSHLDAAFDLAALLNAYVAEQTLERLRHYGLNMWHQENDIRLVKTCLKRARNVLTTFTDIFFYVGKIDAIIGASEPAGSTTEVQEGFELLCSELQNNGIVLLRPYGGSNCFLVEQVENDGIALSCWCLVNIRKSEGVVTVKIHHPAGQRQASELMSNVMKAISTSSHRVNQRLLLRRLHQTRSASRLLVAPDPDLPNKNLATAITDESSHEDGSFCCPIVYRTSFELFHRYATNPTQIARSLAATVLHSFAVANRKQLFVYKDESGSIFYMALSATGGGVEADGKIELLVHGLNEPGPSITSQLRRLLQKRLHHIAVDTLSSVLTKNPNYSWRQADIRFVRMFEQSWKELDKDNTSDIKPRECTYMFPSIAYDPGMILLFFRQNLCGSTFFHRFVSSDWTDDDPGEESPSPSATLRLSPTDLLFYYNNAPSKLDPKFQAHSTLTDRGTQFSQEVGSGIAIIELSLLDYKGRKMRDLNTANKPPVIQSTLHLSFEDLHFREVSIVNNYSLSEDVSRVFVRVKITDTVLKRDVIHKWILLTLNQGLTSWTVERILERQQRGLFCQKSLGWSQTIGSIETAKKFVIDQICSGLPSLVDCLYIGERLPHPAIRRSVEVGIIRSSSVATLALELLERAIFDHLSTETKGKLVFDSRSFFAIRSNRNSKPRRIHLVWDKRKKNAVVYDNGNVCQDSPIDCPEYTLFYVFPEYIEKGQSGHIASLLKLFEEVSVGGDKSLEIIDPTSLEAVKEKNYFAHRQSFAFILSVKKNTRVLSTYNWNNAVFKHVISHFHEIDTLYTHTNAMSVDRVQKYTLKALAPMSMSLKESFTNKETTSLQISSQQVTSSNSSELASSRDFANTDKEDSSLRSRRVTRPLTIRKPKLVGKSVEGAAVHAVAASRARASASRFKSNAHSSGGSIVLKTTDEGQPQRPQKSNNTSSTSLIQGTSQKDDKKSDTGKMIEKVELDFALISHKVTFLRPCTVSKVAVQYLFHTVWPLKSKERKPLSTSDVSFMLSRTQLSWHYVTEMLPIPPKVFASFLLSFGHSLSHMLPLKIIPTTNQGCPIYLMGKARNVSASKCFAIICFSHQTFNVDKQSKSVVYAEGRVICIPRRKSKNLMIKSGTIRIMEKDSTALDKVSIDLRSLFNSLNGLLFDHACALMERSVKSVNRELEYEEIIRALHQINLSFPLSALISIKSKYKSFEAPVFLSSYKESLFNMYDGPSMLSFLSSNTRDRRIAACGPNALYLKRDVVVKGTQSICFMTSNKTTPEKITLIILCRTQGQHLNELILKKETNMIVSLLDSIILEASSLAHDELLYSAQHLHRQRLWAMFSAKAFHETLSTNQLKELFQYCTVKPVQFFLENPLDFQRFEVLSLAINSLNLWKCFECIPLHTNFCQVWSQWNEVHQTFHKIFYLSHEDLFLSFQKNSMNSNLQIHLILLEEHSNTTKKILFAIEKLNKFLIHFLWIDMNNAMTKQKIF